MNTQSPSSNFNAAEIDTIVSYARRGGRLYFRRDHLGHSRVKVKYGPLRMFTRRFQLDPESERLLRAKLDG